MKPKNVTHALLAGMKAPDTANMKTAQTILTGCLLGAGLGLAGYLMHTQPVEAQAPESVDVTQTYDAADQMLWARKSAESDVAQMEKRACHVLYGEHYAPNAAGACIAPVECGSCLTHTGIVRNAVIHANTWVRAPKPAGPDYAAMMRQDKLVFQMSMAARSATEAGRKAYDHTVRCERLTWRADVQCAS